MKETTLGVILGFLGPLGPFLDPEDREQEEAAWASSAGAKTVEEMLDLVRHPPGQEVLGHINPEVFSSEISHLLSLIGARDPGSFTQELGPLLNDPALRDTVIEVIGTIADPSGLALLAPLIENATLSDGEAISLVDALAEFRGQQAEALLEGLRQGPLGQRAVILREIEIVREMMRRR